MSHHRVPDAVQAFLHARSAEPGPRLPILAKLDAPALQRTASQGYALRCVRGTQDERSLSLRPYAAADEDAAITLWRDTWQQAYPAIDFAARVNWWRERWNKELVPNANIVVAEQAGALIGFVTIDAKGYLDQLVVAPGALGLRPRHCAGR